MQVDQSPGEDCLGLRSVDEGEYHPSILRLEQGRHRCGSRRQPLQAGQYIIGADIPIKDEETMRAPRPDYLLALPYSFVEAFMKREAALVAKGTKFIVPLPEVRIVP